MLRFNQVSAAYHKTNVIENVTLDFKPTQITTIIGPNGCGKSTLVQCINDMVTITNGTIFLNDIPLNSMNNRERAKHISILPQTRSLVPSISTKTLVEHGRFPHQGLFNRMDKTDIEIIDYAMTFTNTKIYQYSDINHLSGGERQRVFYAMTLAQDSDYVIMDEPTTYLDISYQHQFLSMIRALKESGKTIILILHDLAQALNISDSLVIMNKGRVVCQNTPEEILKTNIISEVFNVRHKIFYDEDDHYIVFLPLDN